MMNLFLFFISLALSTSSVNAHSYRLESLKQNALEPEDLKDTPNQHRTRRAAPIPAIVLKHARLVFESAGYRKFVKPGGVSEALEDFKSFHPKNYKNGSEAGVWIKQSGKKRIILDTTMGKPFIEIRYHRSGHIGFSKPAVKTDIIQYN